MRTEINAVPLIVFRFGFGLTMLLTVIAFAASGWIDKLYIRPTFFFSYYYFEWVSPLGEWTYLLFTIVGLAAFCIMIGYRYQLAILTFFLSFTYIGLIDKTVYLDYYYYIFLLSLLLVFIPIPAGLGGGERGCDKERERKGPALLDAAPYVYALQLFVAIAFFYSGLARLGTDWLTRAEPITDWLSLKSDTPIIGNLLQQLWVHFTLAWGSTVFYLVIPFLLYFQRTRSVAFGLLIVFYVFAWALFPIGTFPSMLIVTSMLFLDSTWHQRVLELIRKLPFRFPREVITPPLTRDRTMNLSYVRLVAVGGIILFHHLYPFHYLTDPHDRYSWRMEVLEKTGTTNFWLRQAGDGRMISISNRQFLTARQEEKMATQPDLILQYAHFLAEHYFRDGQEKPSVYLDNYVAINGGPRQRCVDPKVDLTIITTKDPLEKWLLPLDRSPSKL